MNDTVIVYPLASEVCIRIGGHCYVDDGGVDMTNPPTRHRICKHCGWKQEGRYQDIIKWADDNKDKEEK